MRIRFLKLFSNLGTYTNTDHGFEWKRGLYSEVPCNNSIYCLYNISFR